MINRINAISVSEVMEKLGDYCSTGVISMIDDDAVVLKYKRAVR